MNFQRIAFIAGGLICLGAGGLIYNQNRRLESLRHEEATWRQRTKSANQPDLQINQNPLTSLQRDQTSNLAPTGQSRLLKLRGEVTLLRRSLRELAPLRVDYESLKRQIDAR